MKQWQSFYADRCPACDGDIEVLGEYQAIEPGDQIRCKQCGHQGVLNSPSSNHPVTWKPVESVDAGMKIAALEGEIAMLRETIDLIRNHEEVTVVSEPTDMLDGKTPRQRLIVAGPRHVIGKLAEMLL
jgi:hypothetical protein